MKKTTIAYLIITLVLIAGIFIFLQQSNSFQYKINVKNVFPEKKTVLQIKSEIKNYSQKNTQYNYEVKADYPEFSGFEKVETQNKINQDAKNFVIAITDKFENDSKTNCDFSNLPGPKPEWSCELDVAFDGFSLVDNKILSAKIEYYQFTGGAHGGTTYEFLNYNVDSGEKINWQDVFKKDSDYLKIISNYSKDNLSNQLLKPDEPLSDSGWIEQGTAPTNDNYNTNIGFDKDGLTIVFQQYQVAAYAAGPQQVLIPYLQLKDVINPNGLLKNISTQ